MCVNNKVLAFHKFLSGMDKVVEHSNVITYAT
jgi:hypothetical protein